MRIRDFEATYLTEFFYLWIAGTSEASYASILDLQRTLFYDLKNFNYSEIDNLPMSELYYLTITGPHEKKEENTDTYNANVKQSMRELNNRGMALR